MRITNLLQRMHNIAQVPKPDFTLTVSAYKFVSADSPLNKSAIIGGTAKTKTVKGSPCNIAKVMQLKLRIAVGNLRIN